MQGLQPGDRLVVTVDGGRSVAFDDCGTAGEGCATDGVSGWAAQRGAGFGATATGPAGEQRFYCFLARFEVGFEEFFPFVFGDGTMDGVFQMLFLVGHSDFPSSFRFGCAARRKVYVPFQEAGMDGDFRLSELSVERES